MLQGAVPLPHAAVAGEGVCRVVPSPHASKAVSRGAAVQASRVKFVFEDDSLEVVLGEQQAETENAFVGGENKWAFSTFTNWEYWFPGFPILVYFKASPCAGAAFGLLLCRVAAIVLHVLRNPKCKVQQMTFTSCICIWRSHGSHAWLAFVLLG